MIPQRKSAARLNDLASFLLTALLTPLLLVNSSAGSANSSASPRPRARTNLYLAASPEVAAATGQYFARSKPAKSSSLCDDTAVGARPWEASPQERDCGSRPGAARW